MVKDVLDFQRGKKAVDHQTGHAALQQRRSEEVEQQLVAAEAVAEDVELVAEVPAPKREVAAEKVSQQLVALCAVLVRELLGVV